MSDVVAAVRAKLAATNTVTALVSTRMYYDNLPQAATMPALVLEQTGSDNVRHLTASTSLKRKTIAVHCYATTHAAAVATGDVVESALEFATGSWNGITVTRSYVEGTADLVEPPRDGSDNFRRVRSLLCVVWHK